MTSKSFTSSSVSPPSSPNSSPSPPSKSMEWPRKAYHMSNGTYVDLFFLFPSPLSLSLHLSLSLTLSLSLYLSLSISLSISFSISISLSLSLYLSLPPYLSFVLSPSPLFPSVSPFHALITTKFPSGLPFQNSKLTQLNLPFTLHHLPSSVFSLYSSLPLCE